MVQTDVRAPDERQVGPCFQSRSQPQRLRIVDDQNIRRTQVGLEGVGQTVTDRLIQIPVVLAQVGVTGAVDHVMQSLGQPEKLLFFRLNHHPFRRNTEFAQNRYQLGQHLGDAAPFGGRTDHPDGAIRDLRNQRRSLRLEIVHGGPQMGELRVLGQSDSFIRLYDSDQRFRHTLSIPTDPPRGRRPIRPTTSRQAPLPPQHVRNCLN